MKIAIGVFAVAMASAAYATVLPYSTGFEVGEAGGYTNGSQLSTNPNWTGDGQPTSGWTITNTSVGGSGAATGSQWVLATAPAANSGKWHWTATPVTGLNVSANPVIKGSADVKFASPTSGTNNRSVLAGVQLYDATVDVIGQIDILIDGENTQGQGVNHTFVRLIYGDGTGFIYNLSPQLAINQYINLGLEANFSTGTITGFVNGVALPDIGPTNGATDFHDFDIFMAAATTTSGGTRVRGGFDNYSIAQVPEPASLALLALGALGLVRRR